LPSSLHIRSGIEEYYSSYGLSTDTVAILVERGFTSLSLLALLPSHQIRYREVLPLLWYLKSHQTQVDTLVERGFTSLSLLALLPPHQIRYRGVPRLLMSLNKHSGDPCGDGLHLHLSSLPPPSASDQV
jgi:hypothetical protein